MSKYNNVFDKKRSFQTVTPETENVDVETVSETRGLSIDDKYKGRFRTTRKLNFRKGPSMSDEIIKVLEPKTKLRGTGHYETDEDGKIWVRVELGPDSGFVMSDYISR